MNDLRIKQIRDFNLGLPNPTTEADDGKILFYDNDTNQWITDDAVTHGTSVINGKKSTAGTIVKGLPVYLVGFDSDLHTVELANATSSATMSVIGFTAEQLDDTNSKHIITFGKLTGIDTTSTVSTLNPNGETWVVNDDLYISTTAGGLTKIRPTGGTTQIQKIAKILKVDSSDGQIIIFNTARTAGLPNLSTDKLWIGDANGIPQEVDKSTLNTFDYIDFNTGYTPTQQVGRVHWDQDYGTLDVDLEGNNINLKVGLDNLYYIKNQSGSTINKGTVVRAAGTLGSSGRILGDLMIADNTIPHYFTLGIAGENILNGDDGYVYEFGLLKGINTTGTPYGETWADGDILYISPTTAGGLTKVEPIEPNLKIQMAIVIDADSNGSIFIRPDLGLNLGDIHNVQTNGATGGDLMSYDYVSGYWEYTKTLNGDYTISGGLTAATFYGDGSNLTGKLSNIVEDTTPQLGGNLDVNGNSIVSTSNADINISPNGTGDIKLNGEVDIKTNITGTSSSILRIDNGGTIGNEVSVEFYSSPTDSTSSVRSGRIVSDFTGVSYTDSRTRFQSLSTGNTLIDTLTLKNGSVGVGTNTPTDKFTVKGTAGYDSISDMGTSQTDFASKYYVDNLIPTVNIISIKNSSGVTTYYSDLQTALNATSDIDTVYIHADIQITSQISIPNRTSLTIEMDGHRIWYSTTSGDFNLFRFATSSGAGTDRIFTLNGGGTLEQVGTVVSTTNAAVIHFFQAGTQRQLQIFAGTTTIKAENAFTIFNQANLRLIDGGIWYSTNGTISLNTSTALIRNANIDIYTSASTFSGTYDNCHLNTRYGPFWLTGSITNSRISGAILQTGTNIGMIMCSGNDTISNNVIENGTGALNWAINCYYAGTSGRISNNTINSTNAGINLRYGSAFNNYIYAGSGRAITKTSLGAGIAFGNTCITNATNVEALYTTGGIGVINNYCLCLNATNTTSAIRSDGASEQIIGNTAIVNNAAVANINLAGNVYLLKNVLGNTGTGVGGAGTNLQTNTEDAYGNIKIG
jgi:hypothetical protein